MKTHNSCKWIRPASSYSNLLQSRQSAPENAEKNTAYTAYNNGIKNNDLQISLSMPKYVSYRSSSHLGQQEKDRSEI